MSDSTNTTTFKMRNGLLFGINTYCLDNHTKEGKGSYYDGTWQELLDLTVENFEKGTQGYRDGVLEVPVPSKGFYSAIRVLKEGDKLEGEYRARMPGETPRKTITALGEKSKSLCTTIILYRGDLLAEGKENVLPGVETSWEIVMINASPLDRPLSIPPMTLMANHFEDSGGTATNLSAMLFEQKLRESYYDWRDKCPVKG